MVAYEIRAALPGDEEQLLRCARHLDSVNLPDDRTAIHEIIEASHGSFSGAITDPSCGRSVLLLQNYQ